MEADFDWAAAIHVERSLGTHGRSHLDGGCFVLTPLPGAGEPMTSDGEGVPAERLYILSCTGATGEYQESIWPLSRVVNDDIDYSVFVRSLT